MWTDHALCKGTPQWLWFTDHPKWAGPEEGRALCARCPVQRACLEDAVFYQERFGLRAGLMPEQRPLRWELS